MVERYIGVGRDVGHSQVWALYLAMIACSLSQWWRGIGVEETVAEVAKLWGSAVPSGELAPQTIGQGFYVGEPLPPVPGFIIGSS